MNPTQAPIACELFAQWQRTRGKRAGQATRPFSRNWEALLNDAGLTPAIDRREAEQDARALAGESWIALKTERYKSYVIQSVSIPLSEESRWCEAFGFVAPSDEEERLIREFNWTAEMAFMAEATLNCSFSELRVLNDFLKCGSRKTLVPIKERSLEIFGDEKRLDQLLRGSALFAEGRLTLEILGCFIVAEPLPWVPGPDRSQPVLVIENAATWHSYRRWNAERKLFGAVVYGCGNRFVDSVTSLIDVFDALGGIRRVLYFGDLDIRGLQIPQEASDRAQRAGLPKIEPELWSYGQLLNFGAKLQASHKETDGAEVGSLCRWLGELAEPGQKLLCQGGRLPQELVGWEFLKTRSGKHPCLP